MNIYRTGRILRVASCFGLLTLSGYTKQDHVSVLIVDGFGNHDWRHRSRWIADILGQSEAFDLSVSTCPESGPEGWNPEFSRYDVVIQTCNDIKSGTRWPRAVEESLESYVAGGGGLFVFHSGNNAFPHWDAYNRMIGLGWRPKDFGRAVTIDETGEIVMIPPGEGERTSHGKRVDALLTRLGDHPIHAGFPRQWIAADIEVYRYARGPAENLKVLSYAKDEQTGLNFPVEWTVAYGKGRVYTSTMGHVWHNQTEPEGMRCAGFQTLIPRVVRWLAGRDIDIPIPDDFPTSESASLR